MPQIKKRRIVLASVLKPVDDTRMLEKLGATLATSSEYEVYIIGYPSLDLNPPPNITFLPLPSFKRLSFVRLIMPWKVFHKINQVKPEVIIINTPELLIVTFLNKILFGRKLVYDVLENYYRTLLFTSAFPALIRPFIAFFTRMTEFLLAPFVDHFFLAEKGYSNELRFARPHTILENKLPKSVAAPLANGRSPYYNLLFSGTLAPSTGVFTAIELCKRLHEINPSYTLTIIGHSALPEIVERVKQEISGCAFIRLKGGDKLVPHSEILEAISNAGTGIIIYPPNPATASSIPTKLYEYLALKLPVIISHSAASHRLIKEFDAGLILPQPIDYHILNEQLANSSFRFNIPESEFWEGQNLIEALNIIK